MASVENQRDSVPLVLIGEAPSGRTHLSVSCAQELQQSRRVSTEAGTVHSYGIGLCRALQAAGLEVVEAEQPKKAQRRGRGKSDPIDAHLAALTVLRMPADRKVLPRNDGDREALRILLVARNEISTTRTAQINRLRALLLLGDDADRV